MEYAMRKTTIALLALLIVTASAHAERKPQTTRPIAGPRAVSLRIAWLYVSANTGAQKVDRVQIGREMVIAERSSGWLRVYANTDVEETHDRDEPLIGPDATPTPVSGWMEAKAVVSENTANGDQILMGEAANQEALASDRRGPVNAARAARLLYRRVVEMFPNSPLTPEAAWRAADIQWQMQQTDAASRPSAHERDPYLRDQMDEEEMKRVIKLWPHSRQADLASWRLVENKLCGDWQGDPKCPAREAEIYEKYAVESPDGPRTAQALYQAVYRYAVLNDMYGAEGNEGKAAAARTRAHEAAARLKERFGQTDQAARAAALLFKMDEGIAVYGIDRN